MGVQRLTCGLISTDLGILITCTISLVFLFGCQHCNNTYTFVNYLDYQWNNLFEYSIILVHIAFALKTGENIFILALTLPCRWKEFVLTLPCRWQQFALTLPCRWKQFTLTLPYRWKQFSLTFNCRKETNNNEKYKYKLVSSL